MVGMGRLGIIDMRNGGDGFEGDESSKMGSAFNLGCQ